MEAIRKAFSFFVTLVILTLIAVRAISAGTPAIVAVSIATGLLGVLLLLFWAGQYISLSIQAHSSTVGISPLRLFRMKRAGADPKLVVLCAIRLKRAGLEVSADELASAIKEDRDVKLITNTMISSHRSGKPLGFEEACRLDRSGGLGRLFEELNEGLRSPETTVSTQ